MIRIQMPYDAWRNLVRGRKYGQLLNKDYGFTINYPALLYDGNQEYILLNFTDEDKAMWFKLKYL